MFQKIVAALTSPLGKVIMMGQLISLFIAATGIFSTLLSSRDVSFPCFQSATTYCTLLIFVVLRLWRKGTKPLPLPWWKYALLSIADVEANTIIVTAYRYTSLTSVQLLDCTIIPFVMILSRLFLNVRYKRNHLIGVATCLIGVIVLIVSDILRSSDETSEGENGLQQDADIAGRLLFPFSLYRTANINQNSLEASTISGSYRMSNSLDKIDLDIPLEPDSDSRVYPSLLQTAVAYSMRSLLTSVGASAWLSKSALFGDFLCIVASLLYATSNVGQEYIVKEDGRLEYLGALGIFGTILATVQTLAFESKQFSSIPNDPIIIYSFVGFALVMFCMYTTTSYFLQAADATVFNLSIMTSDVWAVLASYLIFDESVPGLYFLAFVIIFGGLLIYHRSADPQSQHTEFVEEKEVPIASSDSQANYDYGGMTSPE